MQEFVREFEEANMLNKRRNALRCEDLSSTQPWRCALHTWSSAKAQEKAAPPTQQAVLSWGLWELTVIQVAQPAVASCSESGPCPRHGYAT